MENFYFVFLLMPIIIMSYIAQKRNKKIFVYLSILYLSIIVGFRGINVGIDTKMYYNAIINNFPIKWQFEEIGFRLLSNFLFNIFKNATMVFFIYSFITNMFIFFRLWDFRKKCNYSVMIFLYLCIYIFSTMNIMRQFIAIAMIFYFTRFLEKKKYIYFVVVVIIASQFHKTALLSLIIILFYYWDSLSNKKKVLMIMPILFLTIIGSYFIFNYENDHISNYFSSFNSINNINITFIYRFIVFIFSFLLYQSDIRVVYNKRNSNNKEITHNNVYDDKEFNKISIIYFLGLLFSSTGMFFDFMSRIGLYYLCYEIVYWGYITKNSKNNFLNFSLIALYAIYVFLFELINNGSGIFPYYINFL